MKKRHLDRLQTDMALFLEHCDADGGNPELCDEGLATRMAQAAELVYDSCMAGQEFERKQR